jgi:hypothetical protein
VRYQDNLFHVFPSASAVGLPHPDKLVENIGWAWSSDGVNFTQHAHNPVAPANESTPLTSAMAESHVHFGEDGLVYTYHTIRWKYTDPSDFAPAGRNDEDIGVEILIGAIKRSFVPFVGGNLPRQDRDKHNETQTKRCLLQRTLAFD